MNGLLKIYSSSKTEFTDNIGKYFNIRATALKMDGKNAPAWLYETSDNLSTGYLEELNETDLKKGVVTVVESVAISSYTASSSGGILSKAKTSVSGLTISEDKIYRLKLGIGLQLFYTDLIIFTNI
jgi:hypothetical protein